MRGDAASAIAAGGAPRALPGCPRLRADLCLRTFPPDRVLLFGEHGQTVLGERVYGALVPLLDGTLDAAALAAILAGRVSLPEVHYALRRLDAEGLLRWMPPAQHPAFAAWADAAGLAASAFASRVRVLALPGCDPARLLDALRGLAILVDSGSAGLTVVLAADPLAPGLADLNAACHADGSRWMLLCPGGRRSWIGPVFVPGETACWACWAHRLGEARQAETWLGGRAKQTAPHAPPVATPASRALFAALAATEVLKAAASPGGGYLVGTVLRHDSLTQETTRHAVRRRPQCRCCGGLPVRDPRIVLARSAQTLGEPLDGTGDTSALEALVDPVAGVVHTVEEGILTANQHVHTAIARHFFPMFRDDVAILQTNLRGRSGGKGGTAREARTGAIGEAVERYCGVWQGDGEPVVRASTRALQDSAVPLETLLNFSPAQHAGRAAWNRALKSPHQLVPEPLSPDTEIDWCPAWSLSEDRLRHLPAAYCWYGHPELSRMFCLADSNGCAAASTRERALMKGLLELIERDAVALWWYCRALRPGIDIAAFADPGLAALLARYDSLGRTVWALDVSTEFGVPVIVALSARRGSAREDIVFGFGAGLSALTALGDALAEMGQSFVHVFDGDDAGGGDNEEATDWLRSATRRGEPWLCPAPHLPSRGPRDLAGPALAHPAEVVDWLVENLARAGHEVIALDQTRPDISIPVLRVVAPGLRHFWRRLGPGRLYQAPVALGWLAAERAEADLNPFSIFI